MLVLNRTDDFAKRDVIGDERVRIEIDLVLLYEATDRRDFRDAFDGLERVAEIPILNRTQFCEIAFAGVVNERVFVNPAHAGRVGANDRIHTFGQRAAHGVEIFDHARSCPINVGTVLER